MRIMTTLVLALCVWGCETPSARATHDAVSSDETMLSMQEFEWQNRPLVVYVEDSEAHLALRERIDEAWPGFVERDMVVVWVFEDRVEVRSAETSRSYDRASAKKIRDEIDRRGSRVVLVGKDGGVKGRYGWDASLSQIFELIDSMPMRQREMRKRDQ